MNTNRTNRPRRRPSSGITWRTKRPCQVSPEQEQALDAALARVRRQAVSGEGAGGDR